MWSDPFKRLMPSEEKAAKAFEDAQPKSPLGRAKRGGAVPPVNPKF